MTDFEEWWKTVPWLGDRRVAAAAWQAAQQAERKRTRDMIQSVSDMGNHDKWFDACDEMERRVNEHQQL